MEPNPQESKNLKKPIAHSNFRKGLDDYNDGGLNDTHQLGNDDDYNSNLSDENGEIYNEKLEGKEAEGNGLAELTDEEED